eukprot:Platyproteum_vivax@DN859_c0_g1_i1.p1
MLNSEFSLHSESSILAPPSLDSTELPMKFSRPLRMEEPQRAPAIGGRKTRHVIDTNSFPQARQRATPHASHLTNSSACLYTSDDSPLTQREAALMQDLTNERHRRKVCEEACSEWRELCLALAEEVQKPKVETRIPDGYIKKEDFDLLCREKTVDEKNKKTTGVSSKSGIRSTGPRNKKNPT